MVVFFDIDGTVVDNASQVIPESTIRAVKKLRENGHISVVNTGRPYSHIDPRVRAMDFDGYICACGMEIILDGVWLARKFPEPAVCREVRKAVWDCNMQVAYEADEGVLLLDGPRSTHPDAIQESGIMLQKGFSVMEISTLPEPRFVKLVTYESPDSRREEFVRRMEPWFTCIDRTTLMEYVLKGCSKAKGMEILMDHLGIDREDTLAIGDSTNDLTMFSVAAHTACMGGGMEELKAEAEYITADVMDDGIEKALKHFRLL